jgi:hypothetical protein
MDENTKQPMTLKIVRFIGEVLRLLQPRRRIAGWQAKYYLVNSLRPPAFGGPALDKPRIIALAPIVIDRSRQLVPPRAHANRQEQDGGKSEMGEQRHGGSGEATRMPANCFAAGEKKGSV